jgi:hypothetical protein
MIKTGIHTHGDGEEVDQEKTEETLDRGQEKKADSRQAYSPLDILRKAGYHRIKVAKSSGQE